VGSGKKELVVTSTTPRQVPVWPGLSPAGASLARASAAGLVDAARAGREARAAQAATDEELRQAGKVADVLVDEALGRDARRGPRSKVEIEWLASSLGYGKSGTGGDAQARARQAVIEFVLQEVRRWLAHSLAGPGSGCKGVLTG
jgi:hypothetical protein